MGEDYLNTMPRFCTHCGLPLNPGTRFCGQCGQAVQPLPDAPAAAAPGPPAAPPPVPAAPQAPGFQPLAAPVQAPAANLEPILGVILGLQQSKGFLGMGTRNLSLIVTPARLIFCPVTNQEMNRAVAAAREEAKAQGKGFLGQWGAQLAWLGVLGRQYQSTPVQDLFSLHPGSFFIAHAQIRRVRFIQSSIDAQDGRQSPAEMRLEAAEKYRFVMRGTSVRDARQLLRQTLGAVVK